MKEAASEKSKEEKENKWRNAAGRRESHRHE